MPQVQSQINKKRSKEMTDLYKRIVKLNLSEWLDWEGMIYINEYHPEKEFPVMGRNQYYIPILCKDGIIGEKIEVKIADIKNHSLISM
jgi:tRNA A37 methylthiotransferase MiaB